MSDSEGKINVSAIRFDETEFRELVDYIARNYGIDLSKKKVLAECRLSSTIRKAGQNSMRGFLRQVQQDQTGRLEAEMLNRLTTNYTYFLREDKHFKFLESEILPGLLTGAGQPPVRIWCAGCSSGEECYTLAMCFLSYMKNHGVEIPFRIIGSDISERALKRAWEARYPLRELEQLPARWKSEYCAVDNEKDVFFIKPEVRKYVSFNKMNLMKPVLGQTQYDLIFCRNVMIYFDEESRKLLLKTLYAGLKNGGYLFLGHTELLSRSSEPFQYICPAVYRK